MRTALRRHRISTLLVHIAGGRKAAGSAPESLARVIELAIARGQAECSISAHGPLAALTGRLAPLLTPGLKRRLKTP